MWVNGTGAVLDPESGIVTFHVALASPPTMVRHTAASIFPQCALYNAEGYPALPFELGVSRRNA